MTKPASNFRVQCLGSTERSRAFGRIIRDGIKIAIHDSNVTMAKLRKEMSYVSGRTIDKSS